MWLESETGQGTAFYFTLPLPGVIAESLDSAMIREKDGWRFASEYVKSHKLVLVLSPDPNAAQLIEGYVDGYRVVAAYRADQAAQHLANLLPHALIIDKSIAATSEVTSLLQALPYDLPVIVFSLSGGSIQMKDLPSGVRSHLIKPVRREDLITAIQNLGIAVRSLLVVDDDPAMARFISLALAAGQQTSPIAGEPIRLVSALTGEEALEYLDGRAVGHHNGQEAERPDAILLDLNLPDISGWEVLAAFQESPEWRSIPVILVTAADLREVMDYERKVLQVSTNRPLTSEELSAVLQTLLRSLQPMYPEDSAGPERLRELSA
jgi:CheY-like chemotaxis protein